MTKPGICFLTAVLCCSCVSGRGTQFTILSANIRYCDILNESKTKYEYRRSLLIEELFELRPDVMAIQEASKCDIWGTGIDTIQIVAKGLKARGLNYNWYFWISEGFEGFWQDGLAFLWNADRVNLVQDDISCTHLTDRHVDKGMEIVKSLCQLSIRSIGRSSSKSPTLLLFNTHLDAQYHDIRDAQAKEVASIIDKQLQPKTPAILVGDFNSNEIDAFFTPTQWRRKLKNNVDFIFVRNISDVQIFDLSVVQLKEKGISDHNGLWIGSGL